MGKQSFEKSLGKMKLKPLLYGSLKHSKSLFAIAFRLWWEPRQKRGFFLHALRSLLWLSKFLTKAVAKGGCRPPKPSLTAEVFNEGSGEGGLPPSEALFNRQSFWLSYCHPPTDGIKFLKTYIWTNSTVNSWTVNRWILKTTISTS